MREQRSWTIGPEQFTACTGAKIAQVPRPSRRFDVITLSVGGNDIGFSDAIIDCLGLSGDNAGQWIDLVLKLEPEGRCQLTESDLVSRVDRLFDGDAPLVGFWRTLAKENLTDRGVLVVAGYPRVATPSSDWGAWRGERCNTIHQDDADMLGRVAEHFDERMSEALDKLRGEGFRVSYVSRLALFDNGGDHHSLCARGVEWLNTVFLFARTTGRQENGFHPNDLGHLATAERAAGVVEEALGIRASTVPTVKAAPTPTAAPTVPSGQSAYQVGERFRATCIVAWPTAPIRGSDSIQMRMTCPGVPSQFLFVDVAYADPDLPVSPSRARVQVEGRIVDIARSELGFTVLVVAANRATVL